MVVTWWLSTMWVTTAGSLVVQVTKLLGATRYTLYIQLVNMHVYFTLHTQHAYVHDSLATCLVSVLVHPRQQPLVYLKPQQCVRFCGVVCVCVCVCVYVYTCVNTGHGLR